MVVAEQFLDRLNCGYAYLDNSLAGFTTYGYGSFDEFCTCGDQSDGDGGAGMELYLSYISDRAGNVMDRTTDISVSNPFNSLYGVPADGSNHLNLGTNCTTNRTADLRGCLDHRLQSLAHYGECSLSDLPKHAVAE